MKQSLAGFHSYHPPDGKPFAAPGISVYSYLSQNTRRRTFNIEGLPPDWPERTCPVCGGVKYRGRTVCKPCYQKIRRIMVLLTCCYCGTHFERIVSGVDKQLRHGHVDVYCSKACSQAHHAFKNHRRCEACGEPTPKKTSKYCSKECRASRRKKVLKRKRCDICGTSFQPKSHRTVYCFRACANKAHSRRMRGSGNSHYKKGTSYANWFKLMRPIILERDRHACVACGNSKKLIVHHVDHVPRHNEAYNLVTLCATCHAIHHKSKVSPFPWLKKVALWRPMSSEQILAAVKLEVRYSSHVYENYKR